MKGRWMVGALAGLAALLGARMAGAARGSDSFGYTWYDSTEPECAFSDITPGTIPSTWAFGTDDQVSPAFAIGFPFTLYGFPYSSLYISTNGWLTFIPAASSVPSPGSFPLGSPPNAAIAPLWGDLDPFRIDYGLVTTPETYFVVRWVGTLKGKTFSFIVEAWLFPSGRIEFVYGSDFDVFPPADRSLVSTGIENQNSTFGITVMNRGTGSNGYAFPGTHAVCFVPPPRLGCWAGSINCGQARSGTTSGGIRDVQGYGCSTGLLDGAEQVYTFDLAAISDVTATLSGTGGRPLELYLLNGCNEQSCVDRGPTVINHNLLPAGSYALAIDGPLAAEGSYQLDLGCVQRGAPATCGSTIPGTIAGATSSFDAYPCAPIDYFPGPEQFYEITLPAATNLRAKIAGTCALDAFVFRSDDLRAEACLAHGQGGVAWYDAPPGKYIVAVEGRNGEACSYSVEFSCGVELTCGSPIATLACGDRVSGSTVGNPGRVGDYGCRPGVAYGGGEAIYAVQVPAGGSVGTRLVNPSSPDLEVFLLDACNEGACVDSGNPHAACEPLSGQAATWYAVVDGKNGASGSFDLEVVCGPGDPVGDWRRCETPDGVTVAETHEGKQWQWYTRVPSPGDPSPDPLGSYCGGGCDFSLYVPVECGASLALSLDDVESSGGVSLTEVLTGRRANLEATNNGGKTGTNPWTYTGQQADWLSSPCASHAPPVPPAPADQGSTDPTFNDAVIDIAVAAGDNPCGLWRVDFRSMGGVHWGMFANCSGGLTPGYTIYDNICDAVANYAPRAELQVSNLAVTGTCPNLTVRFDIENLGCAAVDAPWRLNPGGATPIDGIEPGLAPGARVSVSRPVAIGGTGRVTVSADPDGLLLECSEVLGALCAASGSHSVNLQACAGCGTPNPPTGEIGNNLKGARSGPDAYFEWPGAPALASVSASHYHVYRTDLKSGGAWTNLPSPDALALARYTDATAAATRNFYQVRFANDCEDISGPALP